jgi:hypothetical protein
VYCVYQIIKLSKETGEAEIIALLDKTVKALEPMEVTGDNSGGSEGGVSVKRLFMKELEEKVVELQKRQITLAVRREESLGKLKQRTTENFVLFILTGVSWMIYTILSYYSAVFTLNTVFLGWMQTLLTVLLLLQNIFAEKVGVRRTYFPLKVALNALGLGWTHEIRQIVFVNKFSLVETAVKMDLIFSCVYLPSHCVLLFGCCWRGSF